MLVPTCSLPLCDRLYPPIVLPLERQQIKMHPLQESDGPGVAYSTEHGVYLFPAEDA
jgi:hypothetical protein